MDGYTSGPGGPAQDAWLYERVRRASAAAHFEGIWRGASTVVVGRTNHEGFYAVWPGITADPGTDPRTRDLGVFLNTVEKVGSPVPFRSRDGRTRGSPATWSQKSRLCGTLPAGTSS
jgi:hypothetical protein